MEIILIGLGTILGALWLGFIVIVNLCMFAGWLFKAVKNDLKNDKKPRKFYEW